MILEGLVTTVDESGGAHLAPMGPTVLDDFRILILRPFPTSNTGRNLLRTGAGVFHITDDAALIARAAVGLLGVHPPTRPAKIVDGFTLVDCCRSYEFRIRRADTSGERFVLEAEVVHAESHREFLGFHRARHALLEAAILATRFHLFPAAVIEAEFAKLESIIRKTGDEPERSAFAELVAAHERFRRGGES